MNLISQINRLNQLHLFLEKESTGNATVLAQKMGIRRRQLFNIFESLNLLGVEIGYDKSRETYFYRGDKYLDVHYTIKELYNDELKNTNGGCVFLAQCNVIALTCC